MGRRRSEPFKRRKRVQQTSSDHLEDIFLTAHKKPSEKLERDVEAGMASWESTDHKGYVRSFKNVMKILKEVLDKDPNLKKSIEDSLKYASERAADEKKGLEKRLYNGLNKEFDNKGWPKTIEEWGGITANGELALTKDGDPDCYLWKFATWLPNETGKDWEGKYGYNEKLYYVLCHFYWLISGSPDPETKKATEKAPQKFRDFNMWLVHFIKVNEVFLDHEDSLKKFKQVEENGVLVDRTWDDICNKLLHTPQYQGYDLDKFKDNRKGWKTFNQFFYRRFNGAHHRNGGIPPFLQIHEPNSNHVITSPAFCRYKREYKIEDDGTIKGIEEFYGDNEPKNQLFKLNKKDAKAGEKAQVHLKGLPYANIHDLIQFTDHVDEFCGGTFIHYFLSPYDYHRYHLPVSGKVVQAKQIPGAAFLEVNMEDDHDEVKGQEFDAPDRSKGGYEFVQSRGLVVIDTKYYLKDGHIEEWQENDPNSEDIGKVAIIPVGMAQVSGVGINEALEGEVIPKGWEFGRFKFGGSDIILLFDKKITKKLHFNYRKVEKDDDNREHHTHYQFGEPIAFVDK